MKFIRIIVQQLFYLLSIVIIVINYASVSLIVQFVISILFNELKTVSDFFLTMEQIIIIIMLYNNIITIVIIQV